MLTTGQIVYSKCGRDKGRSFIVSSSDSEFAYLIDGDVRKLEKPKKKKLKHIQLTKYIDSDIKQKIEEKIYINDADIRKTLLQYCHKQL